MDTKGEKDKHKKPKSRKRGALSVRHVREMLIDSCMTCRSFAMSEKANEKSSHREEHSAIFPYPSIFRDQNNLKTFANLKRKTLKCACFWIVFLTNSPNSSFPWKACVDFSYWFELRQQRIKATETQELAGGYKLDF